MSDKSELRVVDYDGMKMTTIGLAPGGTVTKEGILAHMVTLDFYQAGINWCVGDLILSGEKAFGEDWILQVTMEHLKNVSESTQIQCQWVSQRFPPEQRLNWLSWTHHLAVAGMDDEIGRTLLLGECTLPSKDAPGRSKENPMGVSELRKAVRLAKADPNDEDQGEKALAAAMRMVERLAYPERARLLDWMESQGTIWLERAQAEERAVSDD